MKETTKNTFYQLILVYAFFILLISLGFLNKLSLQFHILAFIIAFLGISILPKEIEEKSNKKYHYLFLISIILIIILIRTIPYINNSVPLGYDPGIYKYGIEQGLEKQDRWILSGGMEPGFLYLMEIFKPFLSSSLILIELFIFFSALLGLSIYLFTKELINKEAAIFSTLVYALSIVQFKTFWYLYYKNVIGLILMISSLYFLTKYEKLDKKLFLTLFIITSGLLLSIHRPTFYIFGLSYLFYAFINPYSISHKIYNFKKLKLNIISGVLIILLGFSFYIGKFLPAITSILPSVAKGFISPGESPGTFMNFFSYQFSILFYLPISLLGLFYFLKKKNFNMLAIWAIINLSIVYFQFFFFNRFIIHLDIALIILSGAGFSIIKQNKKMLPLIILLTLFISGGIIAFNESKNSKPLISEETLSLIEKIPEVTEDKAKILVISSEYSPWVKGYSYRTTIAPGLFDENKWDETQWNKFLSLTDKTQTKEMLSIYEKPIYMFAGTKNFNNPCFSIYLEETGGKIYKYDC